MNLAAFVDFLVNVIGLGIVVGLIFLALDSPYIKLDVWIKKFAKFAVGGAAALAFAGYCASIFLGVGGGIIMRATPASILEFAIGMLILIVVLYIIELFIGWLLGVAAAPPGQPVAGPPAGLAGIILFALNILAIIVILVLAEKALFGGGLGLIPNIGGIGQHPLVR